LKILIWPKLMNSQKQQSKREKARRDDTASNDNLPSGMVSDRRFGGGLPWAWIALSGLATLVWLAGIGWVVVKLFRWLAD
jgi:hypothetical protein